MFSLCYDVGCAQLAAMTAFLIARNGSVELTGGDLGTLSPHLENLYVRHDGRLLLGNIEFSTATNQSSSSSARSRTNLQSIQHSCYVFVHSVLAASLCASRSVPLRATSQGESYTKKTLLFYLRQQSTISITFPELNATSRDEVVLQIRSSSSRVKEHNYDELNGLNRVGSSNHFSKTKGAGDFRSSRNVIDVDYNCVNTDGAVDQIAELRVTGSPTPAAGTESCRLEGNHCTLDVEALNPGKLLIDVSTSPRGIALCSNGYGHEPKVLCYEYEIMIVIVPREATVSHKSLESVEVTAFVEEAHRTKNPSLVFCSHLLQGKSSMLSDIDVNNRATNHANANRLTTGQLGKVWRNFTNSLS